MPANTTDFSVPVDKSVPLLVIILTATKSLLLSVARMRLTKSLKFGSVAAVAVYVWPWFAGATVSFKISGEKIPVLGS